MPLSSKLTYHRWFSLWVFVTAKSWAIGLLAGFVVGVGVTSYASMGRTINSLVGGVIAGAMLGIVVGVVQWFMLRPYVYTSSRWILANVVGWAIGGAVFTIGRNKSMFENWFAIFPLVLATGGFSTALLRWLVLRGQIGWAGGWLVIGTLTWSVVSACLWIMVQFIWIMTFAIALMVGAVVGVAMSEPGIGGLIMVLVSIIGSGVGLYMFGALSGGLDGTFAGMVIAWSLRPAKARDPAD